MRFNEAFSKPVEDFEAKGAFNARVDVDTRLHIDPSLFKECDIPEFEGAYDEFSQYFAKLLSDYVPNAVTNQRYRAALIDKLSFSEVGNTCLGYSEKGTKGRGTGNRLAVNIANSIIEIYKLGINDPVVFELLPFFEDNIGPDRISDMAVSILIRRFIAYTQRVCTELNIPMQERATLNGKPIALPAYNRSILFVPKAVLCHLPVVDYWWEIAGAGDYNRNLRRRICEMIGIKMTDVMKLRKKDVKDFLMQHPDVFRDIVKDWSGTHYSYNFNEDPYNIMRKKIFISYTWETQQTPGHKDWVKSLAERLNNYGFEVLFDQYQPLGTEMNGFMNRSVRTADRILLICTPTLKQCSDNLENASGLEASMISRELLNDLTSIKIIPIVRIGEPKDSLPLYLGNRNALIWHEGVDEVEKFNTLVSELNRDLIV